MWMLPVELQQIILRYAGIYYARDLDQLQFVNEYIHRHIDAIISNDDVDALKLYHIYHGRLPPYSQTLDTRVDMCCQYNAYQCCEFIFKTHKYIGNIERSMERCILRNLIGSGNGLKSGNSSLVPNALSYGLCDDNVKPGNYANFEEMLKLFRQYRRIVFFQFCYKIDRGDLIDEIMPGDFDTFDRYNWFHFLYKHSSVQNNSQYKQEIGHQALYGCRGVVWHIIWDGYQPTQEVFERYVNTPDREFKYWRKPIIAILKERL